MSHQSHSCNKKSFFRRNFAGKNSSGDKFLDDRGISLPTIIVVAVLALAAAAAGIVIYNAVRGRGSDIEEVTEAVEEVEEDFEEEFGIATTTTTTTKPKAATTTTKRQSIAATTTTAAKPRPAGVTTTTQLTALTQPSQPAAPAPPAPAMPVSNSAQCVVNATTPQPQPTTTTTQPQTAPTIIYFSGPHEVPAGTLEAGNTAIYARVVSGSTTSYYFYNSKFNVWALVQLGDIPYSRIATRSSNSTNQVSKPTNSPTPPSTPPSFQAGFFNYFVNYRSTQNSPYVYASDGVFHYENLGSGQWSERSVSPVAHSRYGLIGTTKPQNQGGRFNAPPAPQYTYFSASQVESGVTLETGNTGTYARVVRNRVTLYYFYSPIFNAWVLVESGDTPYSNLATRVASSTNHVSKPTNSPTPSSGRPASLAGFYSRFENGSTDLYASNLNPSDTVYLNSSNAWVQPPAGSVTMPRSPQDSARFGLVTCDTRATRLQQNGLPISSLPLATSTCFEIRKISGSNRPAGIYCTISRDSGRFTVVNINSLDSLGTIAANSTNNAGCFVNSRYLTCWDTRAGYHNGAVRSLSSAQAISIRSRGLEGGSIASNSTLASGSIIRRDGIRYSWSNQRSGVPWSLPISFTEGVSSITPTAPAASLTHPSCEAIRTATANELWCTTSSTLRRQILLSSDGIGRTDKFSDLDYEITLATNSRDNAGCGVAYRTSTNTFAPFCWDSRIGYIRRPVAPRASRDYRAVIYNGVMRIHEVPNIVHSPNNITIASDSTILSGSISYMSRRGRPVNTYSWSSSTTRSGFSWEVAQGSVSFSSG